MPNLQTIEYGPWRGCVTAREKVALKLDELGPDSFNWLINPEDGRLVRRGGSKIQVDTLDGGGEETAGILEIGPSSPATTNMRACQFVPLHSPSLTNGYESPAWLVRDEVNDFGTLCWLDHNDNSFHQLGQEFNVTSSGHYRQDGAAGEVLAKLVPYVDATTKYGRFNTELLRRYVFAGSRRVMERAEGVYSPGEDSCPYWWNGRFNSTGTAGTEKMRARPWGLDPPLWAPATTVPSAAGSNPSNWDDGDTFWEAWAFKFADGSIGPLFRNDPGATTPARGGLITIGTVTGTDKYLYRTISGIPLGPKGPVACVGRIGFRSKKVARTLATSPNPDPSTMYPFVIIKDNVTTTYNDYYGDDDNLSTLPSALTQQVWPPRAQGAVAVDGRTVMWGKIRPNPYAIIIAPTGAAASRDLNLDDEDTATLYQTVYYHAKITNTGTAATSSLVLKRTAQGTPNTTTAYTYAFNTYSTLETLVRAINETAFGGTADEWSAQLVPGVDPATSTLSLRATTDTGDEGDATGDAAPGDGSTLNVRAYCSQYPFVAAFTETYLQGFPTDTQGLWMSAGDASKGEGCYSLFCNDPSRPGDRKGPSGHGVGKIMGVEPCTGPNGVVAIVFYERARYALRNTKSGGSRNNEDYHLVPLDLTNGCVSHQACFSGPGFAGTVGLDGVWVTEGVPGQGVVLSRDHLDEFPTPGQLAGDLAYAVRTDAALAAGGYDTFTWCGVLGDKIRIRYRKEAVNYTSHGMDYWFGRGENASGLAALYKVGPEGARRLYGWSPPNRFQKVGVHGMATCATAYDSTPKRRVFAWQETNAGTLNGRVDEVDMTDSNYSDDNGTDFSSSAFTACILPPDFMEFGILRADVQYRSSEDQLTVIPYGTIDRNISGDTLTLATSGSNVMGRQMVEFSQNVRGNKECVELKIIDDGSGSGAVEVRRFPVVVDVHPAAKRWAS